MWVRQAAIRPVPRFARVTSRAIEHVRDSLFVDDDDVRSELDAAFDRFESTQPDIADRVAKVLNEPLDETALALGYFLTLAVWLIFEREHGKVLGRVSSSELDATLELLALDEELRRDDPAEALETDDVVGMEQPELLEFIHEHIEATLEAHSEEINIEDIHTIYRLVLVEVLALSYAVRAPEGYSVYGTEALA